MGASGQQSCIQEDSLVSIFAVMLFTWAAHAGTPINIRTAKGGRLLLVIDDESVRTAPGAKPLLVIDGPNILS